MVKLVNDTNVTKRLEEGLYEKDFNPKKCNLCADTFKNISELDKHIKKKHEEFDTFECETCSKNFVTKFRLEKAYQDASELKLVIISEGTKLVYMKILVVNLDMS